MSFDNLQQLSKLHLFIEVVRLMSNHQCYHFGKNF